MQTAKSYRPAHAGFANEITSAYEGRDRERLERAIRGWGALTPALGATTLEPEDPQRVPAAWQIRYMGVPTVTFHVEGDARAHVERMNADYPHNADLRRIVPLFE